MFGLLRTVLLWDGADFGEFFGGFFDVKYGRLGRREYYCTLACIAEVQLIILGVLLFLLSFHIMKDPEGTKGLYHYLEKLSESPKTVVPIIVWILFTPFQLSGFLRRMNDARWSRIWAWLLLFPFLGNVLCMLLGVVADD